MIWTLLIALALSTYNEIEISSGTVWAAGDEKIKSSQAGAVLSENSEEAIDSSTLANFDKCRAAIDFTHQSIDQVQAAVAKCKRGATDKSKPLAEPNFDDVKRDIQQQMKQ
jgi:hypothetical protein